MRWIWIVVSTVGCVHGAGLSPGSRGEIRELAADQLRCPSGQVDLSVVEVSETSGKAIGVRAVGCGASLTYFRPTGGAYWAAATPVSAVPVVTDPGPPEASDET